MERLAEFREAFALLFEINMGVKPGERIVVFGDRAREDEKLAEAEADRRKRLTETAEALGAFAVERFGTAEFVCFPATPSSGAEPPVALWRAVLGEANVARLEAGGILTRLLEKNADADDLEKARKIAVDGRREVADVVVALANNSTSHTRFRALVNAAGGRFASLPHFDPEMFFTSMQVDWQALAARTARLADALQGAVALRLVTRNGTRMMFGCAGRRAAGDDGLLTGPGSFGNLPAGEVYLAPLEGTSEGELVLEYAPTRKLDSPVRLVVREGLVAEIHGSDPYADRLRQAIAGNQLVRNVAELGIGTNDRASRPDNILEAEKILGTVHVALGDNSGFGGAVQVPFHEDYVFYHPTLTAVLAGGKELIVLENGQLTI
ncbi:MAG: aminopeptidase [Geobacter sp.]|nr:aminopeptidase [Geobacter sp.]